MKTRVALIEDHVSVRQMLGVILARKDFTRWSERRHLASRG